MNPIAYRERALYCDDVPLADIAAKAGTPCYVYSARTILENFRAYDAAFGAQPHTVCYAAKANSNLGVLKLLAQAGAGFDIVSGGELYRVLEAGGDPKKIVFSGSERPRPKSTPRSPPEFMFLIASRNRNWRWSTRWRIATGSRRGSRCG